ncbi:MAG: hypothetical protein HYZ53_07975 [Planctomycetes bacterium]|nr:hypothetical protein [Planctomycetota bacterium]
MMRWQGCETCGSLHDYESGFQKDGRHGEETHLPAAADRLERVRTLSFGRPERTLLRCPECQTFYEHRSEDEYFASGHESSQSLERQTDAEVFAARNTAFAAVAWTRGELPRERLDEAVSALGAFLRSFGEDPELPAWAAPRRRELVWEAFQAAYEGKRDPGAKLRVCEGFLSANPEHERAPEVRRFLEQARDGTRAGGLGEGP